MSKDKGFAPIPRAVFKTPLWNERTRFDRRAALVDIYQRAWYADAKDVDIKRGEVWLPLRKMANVWGWSKDGVRRFIQQLVKDGTLTKTGKPSIYTVCDIERATKRDTNRDDICDTKTIEKQNDRKGSRDTKRDKKRDNNRDTKSDTTPIIREKDKREKENKKETAVGGGPNPAPPRWATEADGFAVYGVTQKQWEQFQKWAKVNIPTLMEVGITPVDFRSMRNGSLNNREKFTKILLAMEKAEKPHKVCVEFYNKLERWDIDYYNGVYG